MTLASQDLCAYPNPVDITASPAANATKPTATAFNTTFTSDENAYYSFANITLVFDIPSNTRKRRGELGGGSGSILNIPSGSSQSYRGVVPRDTIENGFSFEYLPGGFLTIPSSSLQSYRGVPPTATIGNIYSFNFADLYPNHVPVLAYEGALICAGWYWSVGTSSSPYCQTIVEDNYIPQIVFPTQFYDLYPQLSGCDYIYSQPVDPPTYLVLADSLTPTTGNGDGPTTPASPAQNQYSVTQPPTSYVQVVSPTTGVTGSSINTAGSGSPGSGSNGDEPGSDGTGSDGTGSNGSGSDVSGSDASGSDASGSDGSGSDGSGSDESGNDGTGRDDPDLSQGDGSSSMGTALDDISSSVPGIIITLDGSKVTIPANGDSNGGNGDSFVTTVSFKDPPSAPATAIFTLEDGETVTATSSEAAGGSPIVIVGSQTLTAGGNAITTGGAVLTVGPSGLVLQDSPVSDYSVAGVVFTVGSSTLTAIEAVNDQGSTVVIVGGTTATVGAQPITLSDGEVLSAGTSGVVLESGGSKSSVPYSVIATVSSVEPMSPTAIAFTVSSFTTGRSTALTVTNSKKSFSSMICISVANLLVASFFATVWAL